MVAEAADPFPPPLSLSDCAEGVFASYQLMLAKESRKNYFRSADGDATTFKRRSERRTTTRLFNHSGLLVTRRRWYNTNGS